MRAWAVVVALLFVGCGGINPQLDPTRNLSPEAKLAYQSMKIGKALDVLRDVAAAGEKSGVISPRAALAVIAYHKATVTTIGAAPGGWRAIALTGLDQLQTTLSPGERAQLAPFIALARTLIEAFVPTIPVSALYLEGAFAC